MRTLIRNMPYFKAFALVVVEAVVTLLWMLFWVKQADKAPDDWMFAVVCLCMAFVGLILWWVHAHQLANMADRQAKQIERWQSRANADLNSIRKGW